MKNKLLIKIFIVLFFFVFVLPIFSQNFYRNIRLQNPRMNGQDVLALQKRLLELSFSELGEADGYYGPITEEIIKKIKTFSGFEINGIVNKDFWDYIFSEKNDVILRNISAIVKYNIDELQNSGNIYDNTGLDFVISAYVYYSLGEKKIRIVKYDRRDYYTEIYRTYYLIDENNYFVKEFFSDEKSFKEPNPDIIMTIVNRMLYIESNAQYEILNGNKVLSDTNYLISITNTIDDIIKEFQMK